MKQTAMVLTCQKPTQTNRLPKALLLEADGEVREGSAGVHLREWYATEKRQGLLLNLGRPYWSLLCKRTRTMQRKAYG